MIKFGIHTLDQLLRKSSTDIFRREKDIFIGLYQEVAETDIPDADYFQERILNNFMIGGIYKRTYRNRHDQFDRICIEIIKEHFPVRGFLTVHDMAASDARSAYDFYFYLKTWYHENVVLYATDILPYVQVLSRHNSSIKVVIDNNSRVLQMVYPPFVFNADKKEGYLYIGNELVKSFVKIFISRALAASYKNGRKDAVAKKIFLIDKKYIALMKKDPHLKFEHHDIFEESKRKYDVIRAMNILNRDHFTAGRNNKIIGNIYQALSPGGVFITGSNQGKDSGVRGGIYRASAAGFELIRNAERPSEIHESIMAFRVGYS